MMVTILSASPNTDGLTAACAAAVEAGLGEAGLNAQELRLTEAGVGVCHQCGDGWGTCRTEHRCQVEDGFQRLHRIVLASDALALVTPVYWGEMSESMKAFTDRLRRSEAIRQGSRPLEGRWLLGVAAAGGGGGGGLTCLGQMERLAAHIGFKRFDLIGVTRWTRDHQLPVIQAAAREMGRRLGAGGEAS